MAGSIDSSCGTCVACGKQCFLTRKGARSMGKKLYPGTNFTVYQCGEYWHYGHKVYSVARGFQDRKDYYTA